MSESRRRVFGPLVYTTAAVAILLFTLAQVDLTLPKRVVEWQRQRALIGALKANNSREREAAAAALVRSGSGRAVPYLIDAAHDSRSEVRMLACRYLVESSTEREVVVPSLIAAASDKLQDRAATVLAGLLNDSDASIDSDVIDCLVPLGQRARVALPALGRLLDDENPAHRALAGIAFATIGGKSMARAIPALLSILDDLSLAQERRQSALDKIRELDEAKLAQATPILIRQLTSKNLDVRLAAMEMLGQIVSAMPAELPTPAEKK